MRIGLDRVETPVDGAECGQCARACRAPSAGGRRSAACRPRPAPAGAARSPRHHGVARARLAARSISRQRRTEHRGLVHRHRAGLRSAAACRRGSRPSATASSTTKVRLRSFDDCEIRCTRSRPNSAQHVGQLVQQRAHAATDQGDRRARRDHLDPADLAPGRRTARRARSELTRLSHGSSDTVTLVSDEPIRSTDRPWRLKRSNTSARKPTCCHMPMVSIDTSTMPLRAADRLDARARSPRDCVDAGAGQLRALGVADPHRHARLAAGLDAARMQHLGAGGGDFLRFLVVQARQQARIRHLARIGAEHAGHVGPDLDAAARRAARRSTPPRYPNRRDRGSRCRRRRARAMKPWVDQQRAGCRAKRCAQRGIGRRSRRTPTGAAPSRSGSAARLALQPVARIQPADVQALRRAGRPTPSVEDSSSPCASTSACQSRLRADAARVVAERAQRRQALAEHLRRDRGQVRAQNSRWRSTRRRRRAASAASAWPSQIACSSLVTPDSADTTTSTRAPVRRPGALPHQPADGVPARGVATPWCRRT